MRKKTTSVLLFGFLMMLTSALASYWKAPAKKVVLFPTTIDQQQLSWKESPYGIFALGYDDCENDTQDPTITAPASKTVATNNDGTGNCTTTAALGSPTASDNCKVETIKAFVNNSEISPATFEFPVGTTTVTWTATDSSGHTASATHTVTVIDNEVPVITHNGDKNVNNDSGKCGATVNVSASATDNCSVGAVAGSRSDGQALNALYPVGTTTISWSVTDVNSNSAITKTQTITVTDNLFYPSRKTSTGSTGDCRGRIHGPCETCIAHSTG